MRASRDTGASFPRAHRRVNRREVVDEGEEDRTEKSRILRAKKMVEREKEGGRRIRREDNKRAV